MSDQGATKPVFLFNNSKFDTAEECAAAINAAKSKAQSKTTYWQLFIVKIVETADGGKAVKIECRLCGGLFATSNISRIGNAHFKNNFTACAGGRRRWETGLAAAGVSWSTAVAGRGAPHVEEGVGSSRCELELWGWQEGVEEGVGSSSAGRW
jgi:hypothetical protein